MFCSQNRLTRTLLLPVLCMSKHKCKYPASLPSAAVAVAAVAVARLSTTSTSIDLLATSPIKRRKLSPPPIPSPSPLTSYNFSTMPTIHPTITLTPDEENLRRLLVDCAAHIDSTNPNPSGPHIQNAADTPLVLRFTGGWVRDKLLQGQSSDIDVGINKMTGYEFGKHLATFIAENGLKYGIESGPRGVHKIESNPEKSKHLETATTRILGLEVDLVNLRSEAYSEDSRIPITMEFGTPKQDALRRDATVNALFYNLHTGQVEDFTERGLEDLEKGLMRTPLKPWETFRDDPLRVLRLIRFASRLGFEIVDEVKEAMRDEEIKRSLRVKISRERVGAEVEKMLKGKDPYLSLYLIHTLSLTPAIFCPPVDPVPDIPWGDILPAINALKFIFFTMPQQFLASAFSTPQERYIAWINAAVIPWRGLFEGTGHKQVPSAAVAAREGLKTRNKDTDILIATYKNWDDILNMLNLNEEKDGGLNRVEAGKAVRRWGANWTTQILGVGVGKLVDVWGENPEPSMDAKELVKKYDRLVGRIKELGLEEAYNLKPVLNGKQLCKLLDRKPGTWMKNALEKVVVWQLEHPEKEEQEAKEFVLAIAGDLD